MKTRYRKRWYHDPDARQFVLACAIAFIVVAIGFWRQWKATDPSNGWKPVNERKDSP